MKIKSALVIALALFGAFGCSDDDEKATASVTTYNVGLARGFVAKAEERVQPVAAAIAQLDTDVVCIQEAWTYQNSNSEWAEDQITAIVDASKDKFPHSFYEVTPPVGDPVGCTEVEVAEISACVVENGCDIVETDKLVSCVLTNCGAEYGALPKQCSACITGQIGNTFPEITETCLGEGSSSEAYNGHNGLLVLSKYPLSNTKLTQFPAVQTARAVIEADVTIPEFGTLHTLCTHLTADLSGLTAYPAELSDFATYEDEQLGQIDAMIAIVGASDAVIMGDMNNGLVWGALDDELPANYQKMIDAGWKSTYVDNGGDLLCTFCTEENALAEEKTEDKLIDHIFTSFDVTVKSSERIMD